MKVQVVEGTRASRHHGRTTPVLDCHRRHSSLGLPHSERTRTIISSPSTQQATVSEVVHRMGEAQAGGGEGTRTLGLYIANVALYQLSYTPAAIRIPG